MFLKVYDLWQNRFPLNAGAPSSPSLFPAVVLLLLPLLFVCQLENEASSCSASQQESELEVTTKLQVETRRQVT